MENCCWICPDRKWPLTLVSNSVMRVLDLDDQNEENLKKISIDYRSRSNQVFLNLMYRMKLQIFAGEGLVPAMTLGSGQRCKLNFGQDSNSLKFFTTCGLQEGYEPFCVYVLELFVSLVLQRYYNRAHTGHSCTLILLSDFV